MKKREIKGWENLVRLAVVLVFLVGLMMVPVSVSANPDNQVSITLPYSTMDVGANFTMAVAIDNITDFDAVNFDVVVDPAGTVNMTAVADGNISGTTVPAIGFNPVDGGTYPGKDAWRVVSNISGTPGVSGNGTFAVLSFNVIGSDGATAVITLENGTVSSNTATEIVCTWTGTGTLTIDQLEVTGISVVGESGTNKGYIDTTNFTVAAANATGGTGNTTYTYAWGFGTGSSGNTTTAVPSDVTYSSTGNKTISLTVTDALGSDSTGNEVTYWAFLYPELAVSFNGTTNTANYTRVGVVWSDSGTWTSTTAYPSTVDFSSANTTGGDNTTYTYAWDFNSDNATDNTTANPSAFDFASFTSANFTGAQYSVRLMVTDAIPVSANVTMANYITIYAAGDIGTDLALSAADITGIERVVLGADPSTITSDANNDSSINSVDITKTELVVL